MSGGGVTHKECCDCRPRLEEEISRLKADNKGLVDGLKKIYDFQLDGTAKFIAKEALKLYGGEK